MVNSGAIGILVYMKPIKLFKLGIHCYRCGM